MSLTASLTGPPNSRTVEAAPRARRTLDHVSVCLPTYRRNAMLERLLTKIAAQDTAGEFTVSVAVVDNDPAGGAREVAQRVGTALSLDLQYDVEPRKGIPFARNRALRMASGNYIAIIDDDEFPPPHWLLTLYRGLKTFDAAGALGPAYPIFEVRPPAWVIKGRLHERPEHRTGTLLAWSQCFTSNVLLRRAVFEDHNLTFDESFKTGGSDQDLFRRAMALGYRFVAVQEGPVYEVMPPARCSKGYFLKRALVNGFNSHKYLTANDSPWTVFRGTARSAFCAFSYTLAAPLAACLGTHVLIKCLEKGCYHLSRASAAMGVELWKKRDF